MFQPTLTSAGLSSLGLTLNVSGALEPLRTIIHSYLQVDCDFLSPYPIIPDGTQSLFMSTKGIMIGGAQKTATQLILPERGDYFGIRFYPGGLRHLIPIDMTELHQRIYSCSDFNARVSEANSWLAQHLLYREERRLDRVLNVIEKSSGNLSITALTDVANCSARHLNRLFKECVGLSPKTYSQIIRLQHICRVLYEQPQRVLDTALRAGYFDQAHLVNSFRRHLGVIPKMFSRQIMSDFSN